MIHTPEHVPLKLQAPPSLKQEGDVGLPKYPEAQTAAVQLPGVVVVAVSPLQVWPVGSMHVFATSSESR